MIAKNLINYELWFSRKIKLSVFFLILIEAQKNSLKIYDVWNFVTNILAWKAWTMLLGIWNTIIPMAYTQMWLSVSQKFDGISWVLSPSLGFSQLIASVCHCLLTFIWRENLPQAILMSDEILVRVISVTFHCSMYGHWMTQNTTQIFEEFSL